jgi:hypothetical protein
MPVSSWAHGFAGKRFFPTTFQVEDPFVSDEFSLLLNHIKEPEGKTTEVEVEYSKRILPNLGISLGESYIHQDFLEGGSTSGFGNLEVGLKYQFLTSEEHETILSVGAGIEIGGTGARRIGAESFSVISPALYFGKGFGDLPESMNFLRPFAITGIAGPNFPTRSKNVIFDEETEETEVERNPTTLTWGFTIQYSLQYLQSFVKDVGLGAPFNRMVIVTVSDGDLHERGLRGADYRIGESWNRMDRQVYAGGPCCTDSGQHAHWEKCRGHRSCTFLYR